MSNWKHPIHPGEILADELKEIGMTALELGKRLGVSNNRLYQIIVGKRDITADTALMSLNGSGIRATAQVLQISTDAVIHELKKRADPHVGQYATREHLTPR